jgi:sensor histidine kinase YesM
VNSLILKEKKEEAYDFSSKFSKLIRITLENSDKINTTLSQELEFVRNYLDLERFRCNDCFDYSINIKGVPDQEIKVPRSIIQTYTENAVKHGVRHLEKHGVIDIQIAYDDILKITITDNGIGRKAASERGKSSTGKGLHIMEQIFGLYMQLFKIQITQEILDLFDDEGKPAGTKVVLEIPYVN